jgi:thymidylate synthase (FAD)
MKTVVLDHGYVEAVETWGGDERIIEAARMSTAKGFLGWGPIHEESCARTAALEACPFLYGPDYDAAVATACTCAPTPGDEKLLRYLWENNHATPFEMAGATFEIQAPIFVFREWHRHRTQSYNELSARYTPLPDVNYVPSVERLMLGSDGKNKQAGTVAGAVALTLNAAEQFQRRLGQIYSEAEDLYRWALDSGVPKELARVHLPVGRYSRMRASANLRNWLAFLTLRSTAKNPAAQWEIRQFADAVHVALSEAFPRTMTLFDGAARGGR